MTFKNLSQVEIERNIYSSLHCRLFFFGHACVILAPQPEIKPTSTAFEAQSPNHWMAREVPTLQFLNSEGQQEKKICIYR